MEDQKTSIRSKLIFYVVFAVLGASFVTGGYWLVHKFLTDRDKILLSAFRPRVTATPKAGERETKRYTQKELEEARKKGELPPGLRNPPYQPPVQSQDAVQRSLRTVEEINRINEMNRRMMEQQQRIPNK